MSSGYWKFHKNHNDSTSNLVSPLQSSSSSYIYLPMDYVIYSRESEQPTVSKDALVNSSSSHMELLYPDSMIKESYYKHPISIITDHIKDAPDGNTSRSCDLSINNNVVVQPDVDCCPINSKVPFVQNATPVKKHQHHYANLPKNHLQIPDVGQEKPRSKSFNEDEIDRLPQCNPKNFRRTLSKIQRTSISLKIIDSWSKTAKRMGRLNTMLLDAIESHNTMEVESMLQAGANPNATCRAGHVSACHAAAYANSDALHLLLKYSAEVNRTDKFGRTPLHLAAWAGRNWTIAMLLDFPTDLQYTVVMRVTPEAEHEIQQLRRRFRSLIDVSCELPIVSVLSQNWKDSIEHKCRKFMTSIPKFFSGWTALHIASYAGHHDATRLLLAAGANPNSKDAMGQTPLDVAGAACYLDSSKVRVEEYVKTIKTLIEYGGKLSVSDTSLANSALHTAVELCSVEAIQFLLNVGAPIWKQNKKGDTPLHQCVDKFYREPLQALANHNRHEQSYRAIDVVNSFGYTVLHAAILSAWVPGVCIALDAGADVTLEAHDGKTAIHLAALEGNLDILDEILLNAAQYQDAVNYNSERTEPSILCAIRSGNPECVQALIDAGASLKVSYYVEPTFGDTTMEPYLLSIEPSELKALNMILHATAEAGSKDMLKLLFDHNKALEDLLFYKCPYLERMIPVEFAAHHNRLGTFKYLLQKILEKKHELQETFDHSRLLYIIAIKNHEHLFNELITRIPDAVRKANGNGYYPLHDAAKRSNRSLIVKLIQNGADLSETDTSGATAISLIIENLSKPTEFLANLLDDYIYYNPNSKNNTDCKITVDYRVLIPIENKLENKGQMRILRALLKNKNRENHRKLLAHPLVESFLYLKWKTLSSYFYLMVFLYCLFVFSLSAYTISVFYYRDKHLNTLTEHTVFQRIWSPNIWQYIIYVTLGIVVIQELSCTNLLPNTWPRRIRSIEFWVKVIAYGLTLTTSQVVYMEYEIKPGQIDWQRHLATVTLVMAWLNIMMLLSKTPLSGYYIQMFWVVSSKIVKIIITFLFLILMFSFCFLIQFHSQEPFEGPWAAVAKTLVMMTEFDYSETFTRKKAEGLTTSIQLLRILFIVFLIFSAIVLMNLTIGVAVHDVQNLVQDGNLKRLDKQVGFLNRLEVSRGKRSILYCLGLHRWFVCKRVPQSVTIKPVNEKCDFNPIIKEAIINKAEEEMSRIGKETESNKIEQKLEKISHTVKDIELNFISQISELKLILQQTKNTSSVDHDNRRKTTIN